jgi:hypothetical protein
MRKEKEVEYWDSLFEVVSAYLLWLRNTTVKLD